MARRRFRGVTLGAVILGGQLDFRVTGLALVGRVPAGCARTRDGRSADRVPAGFAGQACLVARTLAHESAQGEGQEGWSGKRRTHLSVGSEQFGGLARRVRLVDAGRSSPEDERA